MPKTSRNARWYTSAFNASLWGSYSTEPFSRKYMPESYSTSLWVSQQYTPLLKGIFLRVVSMILSWKAGSSSKSPSICTMSFDWNPVSPRFAFGKAGHAFMYLLTRRSFSLSRYTPCSGSYQYIFFSARTRRCPRSSSHSKNALVRSVWLAASASPSSSSVGSQRALSSKSPRLFLTNRTS